MTISELPEQPSMSKHPIYFCLCKEHKDLYLFHLFNKAYRKFYKEEYKDFWFDIIKKCIKENLCFGCEIDRAIIPKEFLYKN